MANNQDFQDLITRITVATNTLEVTVATLEDGGSDVAQAVIDAQQAVVDAEQAALASGQSSSEAQQALVDAELLVSQLEAVLVIEEAPIDGETYGRQDGAWAIVTSGGGGGGSSVESVNSILPDVAGNIELTASDVGAKDSSYVPDYADITGKPSFSSVATTGAYSDLTGKPVLAPVATSGAFSDLTGTPTIPTVTSDLVNDSGFLTDAPAFPAEPQSLYDGTVGYDNWLSKNPHKLVPLDYVQYYNNGNYLVGEDIFYSSSATSLNNTTPGGYEFNSNTFSEGPLDGLSGYIVITGAYDGKAGNATAYVTPATGETEGKIYLWNKADKEFILAGAPSGGGGSTPTGYPLGQTINYRGVDYTTWPMLNPNDSIFIEDLIVDGVVGGDNFLNNTTVAKLPTGLYTFSSSTIAGLSGLGYIRVWDLRRGVGDAYFKRAHAYSQVGSAATVAKIYALQATGNWIEVGVG